MTSFRIWTTLIPNVCDPQFTVVNMCTEYDHNIKIYFLLFIVLNSSTIDSCANYTRYVNIQLHCLFHQVTHLLTFRDLIYLLYILIHMVFFFSAATTAAGTTAGMFFNCIRLVACYLWIHESWFHDIYTVLECVKKKANNI